MINLTVMMTNAAETNKNKKQNRSKNKYCTINDNKKL